MTKPTHFKLPTGDLIPHNVVDEPAPILPEEICRKIDDWLKRYPEAQKRSGVFEALHLVQEANQGYLTVALMDAVANYLELPKIAVYEVATFYSMYHLKAVGKHVIYVCTNISCHLNGAEAILDALKARLGIEINQTTANGLFTLK